MRYCQKRSTVCLSVWQNNSQSCRRFTVVDWQKHWLAKCYGRLADNLRLSCRPMCIFFFFKRLKKCINKRREKNNNRCFLWSMTDTEREDYTIQQSIQRRHDIYHRIGHKVCPPCYANECHARPSYSDLWKSENNRKHFTFSSELHAIHVREPPPRSKNLPKKEKLSYHLDQLFSFLFFLWFGRFFVGFRRRIIILLQRGRWRAAIHILVWHSCRLVRLD